MKRAIFMLVCAVMLLAVKVDGQTLTWSTPVPVLYNVGGDSSRNGVALTNFNNQVYVAYTSNQNCTSRGDCYLVIGHNSGGNSTAFTWQYLYNAGWADSHLVAQSNPALATVNVNGVPTLFLAFKDSYGTEFIISSTDGSDWNHSYGILNDADSSAYGPTLAVNPADSSTLYAGYMNGNNYYPTICKINTSSLANTCQTYVGLRTMNFQPGLAFWNGLLYMAYEDRGDSHCLYGYTFNVTTNTANAWNPIGCNQQTSTAPSLATHNGSLYVAYRSNDSSQKFTVLVSTNGSDLAHRMQPGWSMAGPPALLDLNPSVNQLMNGFAKSGQFYISLGQ